MYILTDRGVDIEIQGIGALTKWNEDLTARREDS